MATDVRTTAFTKIIKEKLFAGSEFVLKSVSHDAFVNDLTVEIPISGTLPDIVENRTSYPISVVSRTDTKQTYDLIEFSLGAIKVSEKEQKELSYDKAASILKQHVDELNDRIALRAAYNMGGAGLLSTGAGNIVLTTGTASASIAPPGSVGTLSPKGLMLVDMANAAKKLDKDNQPRTGRYCLMPSDIYWDFVEINKAQLLDLDFNKSLSNGDIADGIVAKVYGFNIMLRPHTLIYANAATPLIKAVGTAAAATDVWAAICWHENEVSRAIGSTEVYYDKRSATYQGDIYSATQRFNNSQMRTDGTGIVTIVQDT